MQRRKFMQFCGAAMVGTSLALFGTGLVSSPVVRALPGFNPETDNHIRYQDSWTEEKWIGGEHDTFASWNTVWAKMAENVFKSDPLFQYFSSRAVS